jgi:hypothetical protein
MATVTMDVWPFISGGTNFTMAFDYDANGNQIYVGWAQTGTSQSIAGWRIMQQVFNASNQVTQILWPNGSTGFGLIWTNRTTYSYS